MGLVLLAALCQFSAGAFAADWQTTLSREPPGSFPPLRPLNANYTFGWAGLTAGSAEIHFTKATDNRYQLDASGRTVGLIRALWKFDAANHSVATADTLRPVDVKQTETTRRKKAVTHLAFTSAGVTRTRTEGAPAESGTTKTREFLFPHLYDLQSALLYLRSRPLMDGSVERVVVYPATSAYLATITVKSREKITVRAGAFNAIKAELQLSRLGKNLELEPHRKFRRATVWVSDDSDRVILRIDAQIFVGTVFAELQSVQFENQSQ